MTQQNASRAAPLVPFSPLLHVCCLFDFSSGIGQLLLLSTLAGICVAVDSPEGRTV